MPTEAELENAPATVWDYSVGRLKVAAVTHSAGLRHQNAKATVQRLQVRGYTIVPFRRTTPVAPSPVASVPSSPTVEDEDLGVAIIAALHYGMLG